MTALDKYLRLESTGQWRESADSAPREVLVSFGDATLVLSDFDETPLAHWALAATQRIAMEAGRALYTPDVEGFETLEIDDAEMIEAIAQVSRISTVKSPRKRGRWVALVAVVAILAAGTYFAPTALRGQALRMTSIDSARQMGREMVDIVGLEICRQPAADAARGTLEERLFPDGDFRLLVLRDAPAGTRFPGGLLLVSESALAAFSTPEDLAAWLALLAADPAPEPQIFTDSGLSDVFTYVTTGTLPPDTLRAAAEGILAGARTDIATDVSQKVASGSTILRSPDWAALQEICLE